MTGRRVAWVGAPRTPVRAFGPAVWRPMPAGSRLEVEVVTDDEAFARNEVVVRGTLVPELRPGWREVPAGCPDRFACLASRMGGLPMPTDDRGWPDRFHLFRPRWLDRILERRHR